MKLDYHKSLSTVAFKFNLRHYIKEMARLGKALLENPKNGARAPSDAVVRDVGLRIEVGTDCLRIV